MLRLTQGFLFLFGVGHGDQYMMNPRGSNNRLNEKSANRNNGNRLFDSQNNNRGGYNVGETGEAGQAFANAGGFGEGDFDEMYEVSDQTNNQYNMAYQEGSQIRFTWTSQHGCGNAMNNCNMVVQMACDNLDKDSSWNDITSATNSGLGLGTRFMARNGGNTGTPDETDNMNQVNNRFNQNNGNSRGRHEGEEFYAMCRRRTRLEGLFTADQKLKGNTKKYTRQNPNGNRRGLECPEERDYFPWPHPTPWRDLFWIGKDVEYCKTNIAPLSQNVKLKGSCTDGGPDELPDNDQAEAITEAECTAAGTDGTWEETSWGGTDNQAWRDSFCQESKWSQVNHLGNVDGTTLGGQMNNQLWTIPDWDTLTNANKWGCHEYTGTLDEGDDNTAQTSTVPYIRVVFRERYNISTMDYDQYQTFSDQNNDPKNGVISPVTQNPTIDVGAYMQGLRLALNTAQTGRTFQDRSHVITIFKKMASAPAAQRNYAMLNVNVRGKRGNIVQTFPAVEYDFEPNDFVMSKQQCIHLQWTGSNTHNNGNPAGDGQAGDAGEGAGGTDRSNVMEMISLRKNFPKAYDKAKAGFGAPSFFDQVQCKYPMLDRAEWLDADFVKAIFATAGYYYSDRSDTLQSVDNDAVNPLLNNVAASFKQGLMCCTKGTNSVAGDYYFESTRNNNFSNRSQKLRIKISDDTTAAAAFEFYPGAF